MNRTVEQLSKLNGKVYVYLEDEKIAKQFMQDAEAEGFRFGKIKPTENGISNIIAIEENKQLSCVGFIGHMAFQCPSGVEGNFYRIDYKKYNKLIIVYELSNNDILLIIRLLLTVYGLNNKYSICLVRRTNKPTLLFMVYLISILMFYILPPLFLYKYIENRGVLF